ncbi:WhiB family transcriptional regulator [Nesterenkonia sp. CL21]|uniref:WhiB family transcriptional regulator n=1 Tax=unclassified Nesterenkonia TaxID=2629769 RepID=UPI002879F38F|nr:WhiB family transcriptional regulator [Nesterenkonia sp. CL21]MDS2174030.1 WhiB family transcriptional regulator [Nesterenkonia sp. CL21]
MGNAQRLSDEQHEQSRAAQRPALDVPADWFVDPADPQAAERLEHGKALEDQATAFLAAHEEAEKQSEDESRSARTVEAPVALSEAPSRRTDREPEVEAPRTETWIGLPSLIPAEQIEGELAWQVDALCAQTDPEAFFPEKGGSTRDAKKVCAACHVKQECLDYALANDERFGIWGGLSERERRKLRKRAI